MKLENKVISYDARKKKADLGRDEQVYHGLRILEEKQFLGGTSIKYWM